MIFARCSMTVSTFHYEFHFHIKRQISSSAYSFLLLFTNVIFFIDDVYEMGAVNSELEDLFQDKKRVRR
ncbi:hypothetical protein AAHA92_07116 [Salvia divinorum]|uniref:Uncharacterized protein n=1 Tax=Salvia divinorum TaxID=28513 RepID=A0ABD1IBY2_SALDI